MHDGTRERENVAFLEARIMEDYGGLWRIMADYGGLWRIMEDYGGLWRIMQTKCLRMTSIIHIHIIILFFFILHVCARLRGV